MGGGEEVCVATATATAPSPGAMSVGSSVGSALSPTAVASAAGGVWLTAPSAHSLAWVASGVHIATSHDACAAVAATRTMVVLTSVLTSVVSLTAVCAMDRATAGPVLCAASPTPWGVCDVADMDGAGCNTEAVDGRGCTAGVADAVCADIEGAGAGAGAGAEGAGERGGDTSIPGALCWVAPFPLGT